MGDLNSVKIVLLVVLFVHNKPPFYKRILVEPQPEELAGWQRDLPHHGFIRYHGIFNKERVLVTDVKALQNILSRHGYDVRKPPAISAIIRSLLGDGLVVAEGEYHKTQKKALQPAFKLQCIKDLHPIFRRKASELVGILEQQLRQREAHDNEGMAVNIFRKLDNVALDIIGIAGFGVDFRCLSDPDNKLATAYAQGFAPSPKAQFYRMLAAVIPESILKRLPLRRNQELREAVAAVKESIEDLVKGRIDSRHNFPCDDVSTTSRDIIGKLTIDANISDLDALVNQSMTLLGAGHDTVTSALTSAMFELGRAPEIQQRLRDEIRQAYGSSLNEVEDLDKLPYLSAVCDETLRLHPPIPYIQRQSLKDLWLCDQFFPNGTSFMISIQLMNCLPELWPTRPMEFWPDRWLDDAGIHAIDRSAFMSFGRGVRHCIGEGFARAETKYILAALVSNFEFRFIGTGLDGKAHELQLEHGITSRVIGGLWLQMRPVTR